MAEREAKSRIPDVLEKPVKAGEVIEMGNMVVLDSSNRAVLATKATNLKVIGVAINTCDNTNGADGDLYVKVLSGRAVLMENAAGGDACVAADINTFVFVEDENTVRTDDDGATTSKAGILHDLTSEGPWVVFGPGINYA